MDSGDRVIATMILILVLVVLVATVTAAGLEWYHVLRGDQWVPKVDGHWIPAEVAKAEKQ